MTENQDDSTPTGTAQADETDLGGPTEVASGAHGESLGEPGPDLDERQDRMASLRKPMGPDSRHDALDEDQAGTPPSSDEAPTDPPSDVEG